MNKPSSQTPVAIIGAGWAGLACAFQLTAQHIPCVIYEAAGQAGGRARGISWRDSLIDNGQHLLIGAYRNCLSLLKAAGVPSTQAFLRRRCELHIQSANNALALTLSALPAPGHFLWGLCTSRGLSWRDRRSVLKFAYAVQCGKTTAKADCSVTELLQRHNQSPHLIHCFWEPLCLAALSTPAAEASSHIFLTVLRDTFAQRRCDADFLYPRMNLSKCWVEPIIRYLNQRAVNIHYRQRITALTIDTNTQTIAIDHGATTRHSHVVLATPPKPALALLSPHRPAIELCSQLRALTFAPIATVYLQYATTAKLPRPLIGFSDSPLHWLFDRRFADQPGLMAASLSGHSALAQYDNTELNCAIQRTLQQHFPKWGPVYHSRVIREKMAALHCSVSAQSQRPLNRTALPGVWLAGDYVQTGYPSCLEGAVNSGLACADAIAKTLY